MGGNKLFEENYSYLDGANETTTDIISTVVTSIGGIDSCESYVYDDESGDIIGIEENGRFTSSYTYDRLCLTGVARQNYRIEQIMLPLNAYRSLPAFEFYMNGVGLRRESQDIHYEDILGENPLFDNFKCGLTENYVFNHLTINGLSLYYWTSGSQAEVDFITLIGKDIIPVEVKAKINNRSRSLGVYVDRYKPTYSIRISQKNFGFENNSSPYRFMRRSVSSNMTKEAFKVGGEVEKI